MRVFHNSKLLILSALLVVVFGTSSCSSSNGKSENVGSEKVISEETSEPVFSPAEEYSYALRNAIDTLRADWDGPGSLVGETLGKTLQSYSVDVDESISKIIITAESEYTGDDLSGGSWVGSTNPPERAVKVFCLGTNYWGGDVFGRFHDVIFSELLGGEYAVTNLSSFPLPSEEVIIRMIWNQTSTSIDKFGAETTKRKYIGTDQIGVSTANLKKISDPFLANYRKLSDPSDLKYAKRSWCNGACAKAQRDNND